MGVSGFRRHDLASNNLFSSSALPAQRLAEAIRATAGLELQPPEIDTNMVIFHVDPALATAAQLVARLQESGVLVLAFGPTKIRAVTHLDVTEAEIRRAGEIIQATAKRLGG